MLKMLIKSLIFLLITQTSTQTSKLKVSIYYETRCVDCVIFIRKQFTPAYLMLADNLDVSWLPYGRASHSWNGRKYVFRCRHGRDECSLAALHACAVMMRGSQRDVANFINCTVGIDRFNDNEEIMACSEKCGYVHGELMACATGSLGGILLAHFGDLTRAVKPKITFVPTTIFNDKFNQDLQNKSYGNFLDTACDLLRHVPAGCQRHKKIGTRII